MNYKISLDYDDYFANAKELVAARIQVVGDSILFETNEESIHFLDEHNITYMLHENKKEKHKRRFFQKSGIFVGILFVLFLIFLNSFRVSKIEFNGEYPINDEIRSYLESDNRKLLSFDFHQNNYRSLEKNLRSTYYEYEWISLQKKGSILYVTIEPTTTKKITFEENESGDIVAKKDGIIDTFKVFQGASIVNNNDYVKKGDILIRGDINDKTKAKGYVLATTYEEVTLTVLKEIKQEELTGNVSNYYRVKFFGFKWQMFQKKRYDSCSETEKKLFEIPYVLTINKIEDYEKRDIIYIYNDLDAKAYAKSIIEADFQKNKVLKEETILRIEPSKMKEFDTYFEITFLVKKLESIGEFNKHV